MSKEVEEAQCTFTHITDLPIGTSNIILTSRTGRLRWKIVHPQESGSAGEESLV
jgi:hypothetical protein